MNLPKGTYGRITDSDENFGFQSGMVVIPSVINSDFDGEIKVCMINHNNESCNISCGDAIASLICEDAIIPELVYIDSTLKKFCNKNRKLIVKQKPSPVFTDWLNKMNNKKRLTSCLSKHNTGTDCNILYDLQKKAVMPNEAEMKRKRNKTN